MADAALAASAPPMLAAAEAGDCQQLRRLLDAGADPAGSNEQGVTPLMKAAEEGHGEAVQLLLEAGAPWMAQDCEGYTAGVRDTPSGACAVHSTP